MLFFVHTSSFNHTFLQLSLLALYALIRVSLSRNSYNYLGNKLTIDYITVLIPKISNRYRRLTEFLTLRVVHVEEGEQPILTTTSHPSPKAVIY